MKCGLRGKYTRKRLRESSEFSRKPGGLETKGPPGADAPGGPARKTLAARYSPAADCRSTLATGALHFRVRNGIGCFLPAMATKEKSTEEEDPSLNRKDGFETKRNEQAARTISIGRVRPLPAVRLQPIEVVVFHRP